MKKKGKKRAKEKTKSGDSFFLIFLGNRIGKKEQTLSLSLSLSTHADGTFLISR